MRTIDEHDLVLKEFDADIAALFETMRNLQQRRDTYAHNIAGHRALLAPIRRLPMEILSQIMEERVEDVAPGGRVFVGYALASVSFMWRRAALSTFALWKHIAVWSSKSLIQLSRIQYQLSLTSPRPVDGVFYLDSDPVDVLNGFAERWRSITLTSINDEVTHPDTFHHALNKFSLLEELHLELNPLHHHGPNSMLESPIFENAPLLRQVSARFQWWQRIEFSLPWAQLTHCDFFNVPIGDCLDLLVRCPRLVTFSYDGDEPDGDLVWGNEYYLTSTTPVILEHLLSLDFTPFHPKLLKLFLRLLSCSLLQHLTVQLRYEGWPQARWLHFLARCSVSLHTLSLAGFSGLSTPHLLEILRSLPLIQVLRLEGVEDEALNYGIFFAELTLDKDIAPLLRILFLHLTDMHLVPTVVTALAAMIRSRWKATAPTSDRLSLNTVNIKLAEVWTAERVCRAALQLLYMNGFDISMSVHGYEVTHLVPAPNVAPPRSA